MSGQVPTAASVVYEPRRGALVGRPDRLAVEEPLEIRIAEPAGTKTLSVTMRTPGHDFELVAGFLLAESVVNSPAGITRLAYCREGENEEQQFNVVTAHLAEPSPRPDIERRVLTTSACGICGSTSIEAVLARDFPALGPGPVVAFELLSRLPALLQSGQRGFASTGGLHGVALISAVGDLLVCREDVGRHNAVDKVIGWAMLEKRVPLADSLLMVSGRISFEIVQKALRAGIPFVAAVSAATSLAVQLADESGMTLVGFLRGERCTIYAGRERIGAPPMEVSAR